MCITTFFFLIIIKEKISVTKQEKFIIAFTVGKALVNSGASSGLGKFFEPIKVTNRKTIIVNDHMAIFTLFFSLNSGVGFIAELAILYLRLVDLLLPYLFRHTNLLFSAFYLPKQDIHCEQMV